MAVVRAWIVALCWKVLRALDAACPVCDIAVADWLSDTPRTCVICGKHVPSSVLRQHDGRLICVRHKSGVV